MSLPYPSKPDPEHPPTGGAPGGASEGPPAVHQPSGGPVQQPGVWAQPSPQQVPYPGNGWGPPGYAPPGWGQPGWGAPYPAGLVNGSAAMPGTVLTARVLLFVSGGLHIIGALILFFASINPEVLEPIGDVDDTATFAGLAVYQLVIVAPAMVAGALFRKGRRKTRALGIVAASLLAFSGLGDVGQGAPAGLLHVIAAILIIVFLSGTDGRKWFNRPST